MRLALFTSTDPAQRLRMGRLFVSCWLYVVFSVPLTLAVHLGVCPPHIALTWLLVSVVGLLGFYLAFRSGFNRRFRDPSLTVAQMSLATVVVLYVQMYAGPLRGAFVLALPVIFVFGAFKLTTRQLLVMSLVASAAYAATLPVIRGIEGAAFDPARELVLWLTLGLLLSFLSIVAGIISRMRHELSARRARLQELLDEVTELATFDDLTGTYNRRWMEELLEHETRRADREGRVFCIALLDLDHFKRINDTHGHVAGDNVLRAFGQTVRRNLRQSDLVARYGGEEFLVFLPQSDLDGAERCVERIRADLAATEFDGMPSGLRVTVSAGIVRYGHHEALSDLVQRADRALYRAKESGRDCIECA